MIITTFRHSKPTAWPSTPPATLPTIFRIPWSSNDLGGSLFAGPTRRWEKTIIITTPVTGRIPPNRNGCSGRPRFPMSSTSIRRAAMKSWGFPTLNSMCPMKPWHMLSWFWKAHMVTAADGPGARPAGNTCREDSPLWQWLEGIRPMGCRLRPRPGHIRRAGFRGELRIGGNSAGRAIAQGPAQGQRVLGWDFFYPST